VYIKKISTLVTNNALLNFEFFTNIHDLLVWSLKCDFRGEIVDILIGLINLQLYQTKNYKKKLQQAVSF